MQSVLITGPDTSLARRISTTKNSEYPHAARIASLFTATLQNAPISPTVVAQKSSKLSRVTAGSYAIPSDPTLGGTY